MDRIFVEGLLVYARHGVTTEEQALGRPFRVDAWLDIDTRKAGATDELSETADYARICQLLAEEVGGAPRRLVESVAESAAARLLAEFPNVHAVRIRIAKLSPPTGHVTTSAGVEISRSRA